MKKTEGLYLPESFRLWTGLTAISGALERRVWTSSYRGLLYPNLFTILTGVPATGKSLAVKIARDLWAKVQGLYLGPDNPTEASFLDKLEEASRSMLYNNELTLYHALAVPCFEFGVLIKKHDVSFLNALTLIYDNQDVYTSPRRQSTSLAIGKPTINILAAVTPDYLGEVMPESAWGQGFTSRLIFVYGSPVAANGRDYFEEREEVDMTDLVEGLRDIFALQGKFTWEQGAKDAFHSWIHKGMVPVPNYGRLVHYVSRRDSHLLKLTMLSAASSNCDLLIRASDVNRAIQWMLDTEETMPDVFRAMAQKSDQQLIADMHYEIYTEYSVISRADRKPVREERVWQWFENRAPSEKIQGLIDLAVKAGRLRKTVIPGEYIPRNLDGVTEV